MPIQKIYISSTSADLHEFRSTVAAFLRKQNMTVIAMDDYVATDKRPLAKCLADVASADVYVGIFAKRYGDVPEADNPDSRSITELEYRQAVAEKKRPLIFLLDAKASWPLDLIDHINGENEAGKRIDRLRVELAANNTVSFFKTATELAALVMAALSGLEGSSPPPPEPQRNIPEPRRITSDLYITYLDPDAQLVRKLAREINPNPNGLSSLLCPQDLFAANANALLDVDRRLQVCDIAAVMMTSTMLDRMEQTAQAVRQMLEVFKARTGTVIGLCLTPGDFDRAKRWGLNEVLDVSACLAQDFEATQGLKRALSKFRTPSTSPLIGVPLVVAAMTRSEAEQLSAEPEIIGREIGTKAQDKFREILKALPKYWERYGQTRDDWMSPGSAMTVAQISIEALQKLARTRNTKLRGRAVKLQRYPLDPMVDEVQEFRDVYRAMADHGCVVVVDELSLLHPRVRKALGTSPMITARNAAILTISPFAQSVPNEHGLLREELKTQLAAVVDRFERDFDPQCEIGVSDEPRLRRWLHSALPETLQVLRIPRVDPAQVALFAQELSQKDGGPPDDGPPSIL
jgi:hypothetical protein